MGANIRGEKVGLPMEDDDVEDVLPVRSDNVVDDVDEDSFDEGSRSSHDDRHETSSTHESIDDNNNNSKIGNPELFDEESNIDSAADEMMPKEVSENVKEKNVNSSGNISMSKEDELMQGILNSSNINANPDLSFSKPSPAPKKTAVFAMEKENLPPVSTLYANKDLFTAEFSHAALTERASFNLEEDDSNSSMARDVAKVVNELKTPLKSLKLAVPKSSTLLQVGPVLPSPGNSPFTGYSGKQRLELDTMNTTQGSNAFSEDGDL